MKRDKMTTIVYKSQQENDRLGNTNPTGYLGELDEDLCTLCSKTYTQRRIPYVQCAFPFL